MSAPRFGVGFRAPHFAEFLRASARVDWVEVVTEHFLGVGGAQRAMLLRVRAEKPVLLHGLSLSIAGTEPISPRYLGALRALADELDPPFVSDHLCWTALAGHQSHDLLPVAYTRTVLDHVAARVAHVQEALGRTLLLENATVYVAFRASEMSEGEFAAELCRRSGCGLLLDLNNLYVNAQNLGVDAEAQLAALPPASVGYLHVAGHAELADLRIDTHDADVPDPVWSLLERAAARFPGAGAIVERDDALPPFERLCEEVEIARARHARGASRGGPARVAAAPRPATPEEPPDWRALQAELFARVVDPPPAATAPAPLLADDRPLRASRGLRVYSDAYRENLRRALAANFPALARALRADDFAELAEAYTRAHPPRGHDYRELGAELPAFLRGHALRAEYAASPDALADLAALEQARLRVLEAADEPARVAPGELAAIPPEQWAGARFAFARALALVATAHDVAPAVEAAARGEPPPTPERRACTYRVARIDGRASIERLAPLEAPLWSELARGEPFAAACERAATLAGVDAPRCVELAARLLVDAAVGGLLAGVAF